MTSIVKMATASVVALALALPLVAPASAQQQGVQRIPVSSILSRLDRLESELTTLRRAPAGVNDEMANRIDQVEIELRRLTGLVERLEYDAQRRADDAEKRALDLETRLEALESRPPTPFVAQTPAPAAPIIPFAPPSAPPASFAQAPAGAVQQTVPLPSPPTVKLGGEPAVAFGSPRQVDASPALSGLPITPPATTTRTSGDAVAFAGTSVSPLPTQPVAVPVPAGTGPQAQYDEALRLLNVGSFDAAGAALETLVAQYPQDAVSGSAKYWLGDMHLRLGRYNEAAKSFLESFRGWPKGPKAPDSLLKLGMTLAGLGQKDEACLTFKELPALYPDASQSLLQRADIESQRAQCGG
jgi:tol-pal system protein YbgF